MIAADSASPAGTTRERGAQVLRVPPPLYYGAAFAAGMLLRHVTVPLATLPIALVLVRNLVIGPEERYLAGHFGQTYLDYQTHVGRWFR